MASDDETFACDTCSIYFTSASTLRQHVAAPGCAAIGLFTKNVFDELGQRRRMRESGSCKSVVAALRHHVTDPPVAKQACFAVSASHLKTSHSRRA